MKLSLGSLILSLVCLSACEPPLPGGADAGAAAEPPDPADAASSAGFLGAALDDFVGEPAADAGRDPGSWQVDPDAAAPRPVDLWGDRVLGDVAQLAFNPEGVAPCHVQRSGAVQCKGENDLGQLGNGSFGGVNGAPLSVDTWKPVLGLAGVVSMVSTPSARCALSTLGDVWCWGSSGSFYSATPVRVLGVEGQAVGITSYRDADGDDSILAVMRSGHVHAIDLWLATADFPPEATLLIASATPGPSWGVDANTGWYFVNERGQLQRNLAFVDLTDDPESAALDPFPLPGVRDVLVQNLAPLEGGAGLALLEDGRVACWGECPVGDPLSLGFVHWDEATVIAGLEHVRALLGPSCVVDASDVVWCWGQDIFQHQAGLFTVPTRAGSMPDVAALYYDGEGRPALGLTRSGELRKLEWP
jgi:hypothetical protein